ncbi:DNA pilot protein [Tortoise microvirus 20]|nr:DNA pilot protein [Tortoise microvirus 20]
MKSNARKRRANKGGAQMEQATIQGDIGTGGNSNAMATMEATNTNARPRPGVDESGLFRRIGRFLGTGHWHDPNIAIDNEMRQREWDERTSYQRRMEAMRTAGLNPMLMLQGGGGGGGMSGASTNTEEGESMPNLLPLLLVALTLGKSLPAKGAKGGLGGRNLRGGLM